MPSESFDCIILTQTLQLVYEILRLAMHPLHRILRPGGVVLATVPGITQIEDPEWNDTWYWSFTKVPSARRVFEEAFAASCVAVEAHRQRARGSGFPARPRGRGSTGVSSLTMSTRPIRGADHGASREVRARRR